MTSVVQELLELKAPPDPRESKGARVSQGDLDRRGSRGQLDLPDPLDSKYVCINVIARALLYLPVLYCGLSYCEETRV